MNCTVEYGLSRNIKHRDEMTVEEAFRKINNHEFTGWAFVNVWFNHRIVHTTQGLAGYRYYCPGCKYNHQTKTVTRDQHNMIYGG